ncbi:MAG: hypothetical protein ABIJ91_01760, partial [Candidatus Kuenenbacteria bacterium]
LDNFEFFSPFKADNTTCAFCLGVSLFIWLYSIITHQIQLSRIWVHYNPLDLSNPDDHVKMIYKATIMSHVTKNKIDQFILLLKKEMATLKKVVTNE